MSRHISEQYDAELAAARDALMAMGGMVEQQINSACQALVTHDHKLAEDVRAQEARVNQLEVELDDQCISIIARRQPTAGDLRELMSMIKAITDLERMGDEADRIAKMALALSDLEIPQNQYIDFRSIHSDIVKMVTGALDAFARLDPELAVRIIAADEQVDDAYSALVRKQLLDMRQNPDDVMHSMNVVWAARALERIGDHAKNIGEYVVYQVRGEDVRHQGSSLTNPAEDAS